MDGGMILGYTGRLCQPGCEEIWPSAQPPLLSNPFVAIAPHDVSSELQMGDHGPPQQGSDHMSVSFHTSSLFTGSRL